MARLTRYAPLLPYWPASLTLRIAVLSDLHACSPWTDAARLAKCVEQANRLAPDLVLLLGDYASGPRFSRDLPPHEWAAVLGRLSAPLGVHAILGNHDYDHFDRADMARGPVAGQTALEAVGIPVYINQAVRLEHGSGAFWLAGLGSQSAFRRKRMSQLATGVGVDDLSATLKQVTTDEPVILLAHEPDIFPQVPERVSLTLSGHTHGGQVRLFGRTPVVPSRFGSRYVYGHVVEEGRHLIVSAGLGYSGWPIRFDAPAEIVLIELGGASA